ncbi:hypothetical protein [Deinococcus multiflagellatus]|uniref:Uncharacterized protein n=1 Tax=Deinococcus multiflagellatus TaxID=1656887 RepID=A0ABW1ZQF2_9DEIO
MALSVIHHLLPNAGVRWPLYRVYTASCDRTAVRGLLTKCTQRAAVAGGLRLGLGILLPLFLLMLIANEVGEKEYFAVDLFAMSWVHRQAGDGLLSVSIWMNQLGTPLATCVVTVLPPLALWFMNRRPQALFALVAVGALRARRPS